MQNRNLFLRLFDEIRYLGRLATAGSKEARELEKIKKLFDEAYRETKNTAQPDGVKKAADKKSAEISHIRELVENARLYAEDANVEHNKFKYFCYYIADVKYENETFPIYLNVGLGINDNKYHLYDITNRIRDTADRINGLERPGGYALTNGVSNDIIDSDSKNVNRKMSLSMDNADVPQQGNNIYDRDVALENREETVPAGYQPDPDQIVPTAEDIAAMEQALYREICI